ncbi:two-component regulator propeller domain-containing protein [Flavilitoribacter nigricans]|uniref:histidine kinase n=1 Tax=Flavilitoribacter nigricans (strain ATCC 23147 / DSM 23189 / NBRC 102662 / NCIMB 1420 / SS-2) TaxID=1122177 RepID=A0A2D0NBD2_FLAN2|nr:two-component regulator propeller domain-containing protein [Flavilitoribacter nigricans]PHN05688.1 hypothetical protein CRP01_14515 [Flavilitoribacter nigricans DSM 23189 = NBRC 102662]
MRLLLSTTFLVFFNFWTFAQQLSFHKLSTQQGLSHSTVYAITQDDRGFMWIGTREGLNRYDSYELKTYYADGERSNLASNQINALLATDEQLLVGTSNGLSLYLPAKDQFVRIGRDSLNESINQIYRGQDSTIFVCTNKGLYRLNDDLQPERLMGPVSANSICNYKSNVFWLALNREVMLINHLGEVIKSYRPQQPPELQTQVDRLNTMHRIIQDREGDIWLITDKGLFRYDPPADEFQHVPIHRGENGIEANVIRTIDTDQDQRLWLGTELGLFIYDKKSGEVQHYNQSFTDANTLSDKSIYALYLSRENIAWIGTYFGGLNYTKPESNGFYKLMPARAGQSISGKAISQITETTDGRLWIGTEDGGISIYDKDEQTFEYLRTDGDPALSCNNVHAIHDDQLGNIWIGTFLGGLNRYDSRNGRITVYKKDPADPHSLSNDYVYSIRKDSRNVLWVGTQRGLNIYNYERDHFELFRPEELGGVFVYDILEDRQGDLWFCTRWTGIYRYQPAEDRLHHYVRRDSTTHGLSSNQIVSAFEDRHGDLWFGSLNGGLIHWNRQQQQFSSVTQANGLPNDNVYGILEDERGKLWLPSNKGLTRYDPDSGRITNFTTAQGLSENQFNFKSFYTDTEGWFYFGTVNGLNFFHPDSSDFRVPPPELYFTGFKLFNKDVPISEKGPLQSHIDQTEKLTLRHRDNVLTLEFVALNYFSEGKNEYAYYLEGFEDNWNEVGNKRTATYTNLSPGDYVFHLRATGQSGALAGPERRIQLSVLPPFWQSNWALLLYSVLIIGLIVGYTRFVRFLHRQKLAVQVERVEKEKIREINQHKLNFFTFISHEFKTPLTLIIASIEKFFQSSNDQRNHPDELLSIKRNANRLHHLIQQLMEFRKIETRHASLDLRKGDVVLFLRDTFQAFSPLFKHRGIRYEFTSSHAEYYAFFDPDKLEMILSNLVSNSAEHTPENGHISLAVNIQRPDDKNTGWILQLLISDSGSGILEEDTSMVFAPFFKAGKEEQQGSGIGLALVRSLVEFLDGRLQLESQVGNGTAVTVELPLRHKPLTETEAVSATVNGNKDFGLHSALYPEPVLQEIADTPLSSRDQTLLIVEDNRELLKFLHKHFVQQYKVQLARNGEEALKKIRRTIPDLILSDARMPVMDGIELCEQVKANPQTSHIPFLLLTAKTSDQHRMEGLRMGANAYLTKPFNLKELDLLVYNTLHSGQKLQQRFSNLERIEPEALPPNNQDREFLHQVTKLVGSHFADPGFTISGLAQMLGISRSLLHLKMKKIMNVSASEYIKRVRMEKAQDLLQEGLPISEVAYKVGYNDPNYFSKVFKKQFRILPSAYVEQIAGE